MTDRRVRQTGKDTDGDITALCNTGEARSPRPKADAIADIEGNSYRYFVHETGERTFVHVVNGSPSFRRPAELDHPVGGR